MVFANSASGYVIVSGPPGAGKSTLAGPLAAELELPLLAKDSLKRAMMSVLPVEDVEQSRAIGRAAVAALLAVADGVHGAVLDSVWYRSRVTDRLRALPGSKVEVFCRCDRDLVARRYVDRAGGRGPGHFDDERPADELWSDEVAVPVAGGWPVLEVDTSRPVDVPALARDVSARLRLPG